MKKFRSPLIILLVALALLIFPSCDPSEPSVEQETSETSTSAPTEESTEAEADPQIFNIFSNGEYACHIVCSETATDLEKEIYTKLRDKLKSITGSFPKFYTDFIAYNDTGVDRKAPAILIGYTNYEESRAVYNDLRCGEAKVKVEGNKLVLAFSSEEDANSAYIKLLVLLNKQTDGNLSIPIDTDITDVTDEYLTHMPTYPSGRTQVTYAGNDSYMVHAGDATAADLNAYKDKVLEAGFTLRGERTVSDNIFYTFVSDLDYIYMYYRPYDKSIRAIIGPVETLANDNYIVYGSSVVEPSLTLIGQNGSIGQGYIFVLPDGRLIIQDGGSRSSKRPDNVYKAIVSAAPDPDNIVIAAWYISHPHSDHQNGVEEFIDNHSGDANIKVHSFVLNYAPPDMYDYKRPDGAVEKEKNRAMRMFTKIEEAYPDAQIIKAHTGQLIKYGDEAYVEILYTPEDYLPADIFDYVNSTSLVIRVTVKDTSVLLLADTTHASGRILENTFGAHLESDMVQLAHHGQYPSNASLYTRVQAKVLLWPSNYATGNDNLKNHGGVIDIALSYASDVYLSDSAYTTLPLPYVIVNNKESELEKFN